MPPNRDTGLEIPKCWMAAWRKQEASTNYANPRLLVTHIDEARMNCMEDIECT